MKFLVKQMIVITILMLSIATTGISQKYDNFYEYGEGQIKDIYKFGIGKLFVRQFFFGYERLVSDQFSITSQVGFLGKAFYLETLSEMNGIKTFGYIRTEKTPTSDFFHKRTFTNFGCQINFGIRYYPSGLEEIFFLGVRGGYQYADFGNDLEVFYYDNVRGSRLSSKILDIKQNSYFYGGSFGANLILGEKTALEFYLLIGRRYSKLIAPEFIEVIPNPAGSTFGKFQNNHLNSIHRIHFELGIYLGIGQ